MDEVRDLVARRNQLEVRIAELHRQQPGGLLPVAPESEPLLRRFEEELRAVQTRLQALLTR